jgi:thioesterase domain-containing protein
LGLKSVGIDHNFFELGGHSLNAVRLLAQIEKELDVDLPLHAVFKAPTVERLASIVRGNGWVPPKNCLVEIRARGCKPPLFLIHDGYSSLVKYLADDRPVYSLSLLGLFDQQVVSMRLEDIAASYIESIRTLQPTGPYYIGGHSAAGVVAFETARQLHMKGERVALLALFDTQGPKSRALPIADKIRAYLTLMRQMELRDSFCYALAKFSVLKEEVVRSFWRLVHYHSLRVNLPLALTLRNIKMIYLKALRDYLPEVHPGGAVLFRAQDRSIAFEADSQLGWNGMAAGGLTVHEVPGNHFNLLAEPHVRAVAERLNAYLRESQPEP